MARIRSINPDACKSEKLAAVGAEAERCFWRLQTHCDDEGRAEDNPRLIWAALFPLHDGIDAGMVDGWLSELADAGLVTRYEAEGVRVVQVERWGDYQHPQRPRPSTLPSRTPRVHVPEASATAPVRVSPGVGVGVGDGGGAVDAHAHQDSSDGLVGEIVSALHSKPDTTTAMVCELIAEGVPVAVIRSHLSTTTPTERGRPWDFARRVRQGAHQLALVGADSKVAPLLERQMARIAEADARAKADAVPMPEALRARSR